MDNGMTNNNKRGRGRPKGSKAQHTLLSEKLRETIVETVHANAKPILDGQVAQARGIYVMAAREKIGDKRMGKWYAVKTEEEFNKILEEGNDAAFKVYVKEPDVKAASYLLDQAAGRAKQTVETPGLTESLAAMVERLNGED